MVEVSISSLSVLSSSFCFSFQTFFVLVDCFFFCFLVFPLFTILMTSLGGRGNCLALNWCGTTDLYLVYKWTCLIGFKPGLGRNIIFLHIIANFWTWSGAVLSIFDRLSWSYSSHMTYLSCYDDILNCFTIERKYAMLLYGSWCWLLVPPIQKGRKTKVNIWCFDCRYILHCIQDFLCLIHAKNTQPVPLNFQRLDILLQAFLVCSLTRKIKLIFLNQPHATR